MLEPWNCKRDRTGKKDKSSHHKFYFQIFSSMFCPVTSMCNKNWPVQIKRTLK